MDNIKRNFGFGFMRLPQVDGAVDIPETKKMVDAFLEAGFNYFDTAHGYLQGRSSYFLFQRRQAALGINEASFASALDCTVFLRLALVLSENAETFPRKDIAHTFSCIEIIKILQFCL